MKGTNLGEFEELLLLIALILKEDAYVLRIQEELKNQINRKTSMGALHASLSRLEDKGFLVSEMTNPSRERGGRRKRVYQLTASGKTAVNLAREMRDQLWNQIPQFSLDFYAAF